MATTADSFGFMFQSFDLSVSEDFQHRYNTAVMNGIPFAATS